MQGRLPNFLGGVRVRIRNVAAPLFLVSPLQINVQVPSSIPPGTWALQVNRENLSSNLEMIEVRAVSSGLFSWPFSFVEGPPRAAVTHRHFSLVGRGDPEGATPAHPGEIIVLWVTGFGSERATNPPVSAGELPNSPAWLVRPLKVWLEETLAPDNLIFYAGVAPGFAGLYQINLLLGDDVPTGDVEVVVEVDGIQSQLGMTIPIDPLAEP